MNLGPFIHCIYGFLKYENTLELDFKLKNSAGNYFVFKNQISSIKIFAGNYFVFKNQISSIKILLEIILSLKIRFQA